MEQVGALVMQQKRLCEVMVCLNSAIGALCGANNIPFGFTTYSDGKGVSGKAEHFLSEPISGPLGTCFARQVFSECELHCFSAAARNSLILPVQYQCRAIDQAFMLDSIQKSNLLRHIDTLYDVFLLSENGNFLVNFAGLLVDSHLAANAAMGFALSAHRYVDSMDGGGRMTTNREIEEGCFTYLWSMRGVASAFQRAKQYAHTSHIDLASFRIDNSEGGSTKLQASPSDTDEILYVMSDRADPSSAVQVVSGFRYEHIVNTFSIKGLDRLLIEYAAPWPFKMILSEEYMTKLSLVSRRLLEIAQLTALSREVFGHMAHSKRAARGQTQQHSGGVDRYRVMYLSFCQIRQAFQAIANFTADRLRAHKKHLKRDLFLSCQKGFEPFMAAMRQHVCRLCDDVFIMPPQALVSNEVGLEEDGANDDTAPAPLSSELLIAESISALLESCRASLCLLYKELVKTDPDNISVIITSMALLKARIVAIRVHSEQLEMVTNGNIECLLMYLESAE